MEQKNFARYHEHHINPLVNHLLIFDHQFLKQIVIHHKFRVFQQRGCVALEKGFSLKYCLNLKARANISLTEKNLV